MDTRACLSLRRTAVRLWWKERGDPQGRVNGCPPGVGRCSNRRTRGLACDRVTVTRTVTKQAKRPPHSSMQPTKTAQPQGWHRWQIADREKAWAALAPDRQAVRQGNRDEPRRTTGPQAASVLRTGSNRDGRGPGIGGSSARRVSRSSVQSPAGKTTSRLQAIANAQSLGGIARVHRR